MNSDLIGKYSIRLCKKNAVSEGNYVKRRKKLILLNNNLLI